MNGPVIKITAPLNFLYLKTLKKRYYMTRFVNIATNVVDRTPLTSRLRRKLVIFTSGQLDSLINGCVIIRNP